jgi:Ca-activated chloride channel family protein
MINKWLAPYNLLFAQPIFLWLLLLLPLLIWLSWFIQRNRSTVWRISTTERLRKIPVPARIRWMPVLQVLHALAFVAIVIALARPQRTDTTENIDSNGIDIVLSMDISGSMLAEDFKPNRLEAAKNTAMKFVGDRVGDRIGFVIFAGESFTQCPITIDHRVVMEQINNVRSGLLDDGTAIGMGLATAVDRLRDAQGKSRVVILMTDGVNSVREGNTIDPITALEIAKAFKVKVYTIGIGTQGKAMYPIPTPNGVERKLLPVQIDEALLKKMSQETGGKYYRATDNKSLEKIYNEIDKLEKTKVEISAYTQYTDLFFPFALAAIILLALELLLRNTVFRTLP